MYILIQLKNTKDYDQKGIPIKIKLRKKKKNQIRKVFNKDSLM